jgi:hemoglobin
MPISVVVSDFIAALVPDPLMNENPAIETARKQVPAAYLNYHVTAFVCMATGGPCGYTGRGMPESHAHLNISGREWDRMMTIFVDVLANHKVPERETRELVALLGTTRDAIVTAD